ncbi:MAG: protein-disulfide reductase DsbD family protein [Verrucomicrobia bacterium]|nr:protein-disulfide reductase DsbD family protein [Verrucomicrobiota bacterium]
MRFHRCPGLFALAGLIGLTLAAPLWAQDISVTADRIGSPDGHDLIAVRFSIPDDHYLYAERLSISGVNGLSLEPHNLPDPKSKYDPFFETNVSVYVHDVTFVYRASGTGDTARIGVTYQACNDSICFFPVELEIVVGDTALAESAPATASAEDVEVMAVTEFHPVASASGYLNAGAFLKFLDQAESGLGHNAGGALDTFRQRGVWLSMLLIVLWGAALNLTPCVLPLIPINLAIIGAGAQASSRARGFLLGGAYGAAIALVYGALGLIVVLTGAQFGSLNSTPTFNFVIAAIFVVLGLGMFDVLPIDFSRLQGGAAGKAATRGKFLTAFMMGGISALLAGACVAPVVIWVLLLAADLFARGQHLGLLLPFLLGLGMAIPWPFAGAGLSFLPKPGRWMDRVKKGFGVLIVLFACWYGYLGVTLLQGRSASHREAVIAEKRTHATGDWYTSIDEAVMIAGQEKKPVFIDIWASWCKNCLTMEKSTFKDPEVARRLDRYVKVKFQAEDLSDPAIKSRLDDFGVLGLPTYIIMHSNGGLGTP